MEETKGTWQKIENKIKKIGLGDGLSSGQETNFQHYFNTGFSEGFRNAYAIGQYKGALLAKSVQQNIPLSESQHLSHPKTGWCQLCQKNALVNENISNIIADQTEFCDKNLHQLNSLYSITN